MTPICSAKRAMSSVICLSLIHIYFISNYTALVQAIQEAYPYTDLIVNTVPPIPENHSNYPHMDQAKIDDFNMALLNMCEQLGVRFLNTAEVLKGENGYGQPEMGIRDRISCRWPTAPIPGAR